MAQHLFETIRTRFGSGFEGYRDAPAGASVDLRRVDPIEVLPQMIALKQKSRAVVALIVEGRRYDAWIAG